MAKFICRVCGSEKYYLKDCGFGCAGCSILFTDIEKMSIPPFKLYIRPYTGNLDRLEIRGIVPNKLKTPTDTGYDLYAVDRCTIDPGKLIKFDTNITIVFPAGYAAQVRPRSGLSSKHKLCIINSPGTIDNEYIGDISVPIMNIGETPYTIEVGEKIAQLVIEKVIKIDQFEIIDSLDGINTIRGEDGYSSSGRFQ